MHDSLNKFLPASNLKPGTHLKTPDRQAAIVVGGSTPAVHDGWMWDLTVPGNGDHDFYVIPAQAGNSHHAYYVVAGTALKFSAKRPILGDSTS